MQQWFLRRKFPWEIRFTFLILFINVRNETIDKGKPLINLKCTHLTYSWTIV